MSLCSFFSINRGFIGWLTHSHVSSLVRGTKGKKGNESHTDYLKMMKIVKAAGYRGWVGIEVEGGDDQMKGIKLTESLLERVRKERA